jgi:cobalamin biosynthesis Mg chelatase CobN
VTSVDPEAALTLTQTVASDPQVTTGSVGGGSEPAPGEPAATTSDTVDDGVPEITADAASSQDDDSGTSPVWWIVGGVAALAAVAVGVMFVARGRTQGPID